MSNNDQGAWIPKNILFIHRPTNLPPLQLKSMKELSLSFIIINATAHLLRNTKLCAFRQHAIKMYRGNWFSYLQWGKSNVVYIVRMHNDMMNRMVLTTPACIDLSVQKLCMHLCGQFCWNRLYWLNKLRPTVTCASSIIPGVVATALIVLILPDLAALFKSVNPFTTVLTLAPASSSAVIASAWLLYRHK